jgi:pimeloyl-ACP methyl ester carboxylesterase
MAQILKNISFLPGDIALSSRRTDKRKWQKRLAATTIPAEIKIMIRNALVVAFVLAVFGAVATVSTRELGKPGVTPVPCADQRWEQTDPTFTALSGAKAFFGQSDGGAYRIEIPDNWNGELVLWAHGYVANAGAQGSRLRVGLPGVGDGSPFRAHLISAGFAWAASSYRCNGYVPGQGLLDTIALIDLFKRVYPGNAPQRVYLTGVSMGGHVTLLGMQEFPTTFAGGLALCASGPGEMDFLTSVAAASELISGVTVTQATREKDVERLTAILGKPPGYTDKGRQLASIQVEISGGPRPFALEGLASRFIENASTVAGRGDDVWNRVASNTDLKYHIDDGLGLTDAAINSSVRRKAADGEVRSVSGPYEEAIPFDGRIERPVLTLHGSGDLYVPISLQQSLRRTVDNAGKSSWLVQRIIRSPGHCNFSAPEQADAFDALVAWARSGKRPEGDEVLGDLTDAGMKFTNPLRPRDPGVVRVQTNGR